MQFQTTQIDRETGQIVAAVQGSADSLPVASPTVEIIDATAYAISVIGIPTAAALNTPFSFTVGWSQIAQTTDPFPASPIAVEVDGAAFPHTLDPVSHQTTVTVTPNVAGPMQIRVGDSSYMVEVS